MDSSTDKDTRAAGDSGDPREPQKPMCQTVEQFFSRVVCVELEEAMRCMNRARKMAQEIPAGPDVSGHLDMALTAALDAHSLIREAQA